MRDHPVTSALTFGRCATDFSCLLKIYRHTVTDYGEAWSAVAAELTLHRSLSAFSGGLLGGIWPF